MLLMALSFQFGNAAPPESPAPKGALRLTLQGYELSPDAAAVMLLSQPPEVDPQAMVVLLAQMVAQQKASIVKMPAVDLPKKEGNKAAQASATEGVYTLQASLGPGGTSYLEVIYVVTSSNPTAMHGNWMVCRPGQIHFLYSTPSAAAEKIMLVFARVTES